MNDPCVLLGALRYIGHTSCLFSESSPFSDTLYEKISDAYRPLISMLSLCGSLRSSATFHSIRLLPSAMRQRDGSFTAKAFSATTAANSVTMAFAVPPPEASFELEESLADCFFLEPPMTSFDAK